MPWAYLLSQDPLLRHAREGREKKLKMYAHALLEETLRPQRHGKMLRGDPEIRIALFWRHKNFWRCGGKTTRKRGREREVCTSVPGDCQGATDGGRGGGREGGRAPRREAATQAADGGRGRTDRDGMRRRRSRDLTYPSPLPYRKEEPLSFLWNLLNETFFLKKLGRQMSSSSPQIGNGGN